MEEALVDTGIKRRTVGGGRGTAWWSESWALFMKNPGMWVVFGLIFFVGCGVIGIIPVIGGVVVALLTPVLEGGWVLSARKLETGGTLEVADLFSGFKDKLNGLLALGAVALVASIVIFAVMAVLGAGAIMGLVAGGATSSTGGIVASLGVGFFALIVGLALGFVFALAFWFAPALVVLRNVAPVEALKTSWAASLANIGPFVVYGLLWIVAAVLASIPLGLGWVLLGPLTMLAMYASYQDVFERQ